MAGLPIKIERTALCRHERREVYPIFWLHIGFITTSIVAASSLPFRSAEFEPARQRF